MKVWYLLKFMKPVWVIIGFLGPSLVIPPKVLLISWNVARCLRTEHGINACLLWSHLLRKSCRSIKYNDSCCWIVFHFCLISRFTKSMLSSGLLFHCRQFKVGCDNYGVGSIQQWCRASILLELEVYDDVLMDWFRVSSFSLGNWGCAIWTSVLVPAGRDTEELVSPIVFLTYWVVWSWCNSFLRVLVGRNPVHEFHKFC